MKKFVSVLALTMCVAGSSAHAQQKPMTPDELAKIKADVTAAAHNYMALFSKEDAKGVADTVYSHPSIAINDDGVTITDPAKQAEGYANNIKNLKKGGWVKSLFLTPTVCVINRNVALMNTRYARYDKDNKVILEGGETDLFARTPDGWKLVALFGDAADKKVTCND